jgi:Flp pilus assembly protein TadD
MRVLRLVLLAALAALAASLALAGCGPKPAARSAPAGALARSQALIDSGNVAYRTGDFENAARRYASAAVAKPDDPAAFFGLGMALAKLGRDDDARVAYSRARALSGGAAADTAFPH